MMKQFIKKILREGLLTEGEITSSQLNQLENQLDDVFATIGIDINFTKHFLDRANDARNQRDITIDELRDIFKDVYAEYKNQLRKFGAGFEGVFKNPPTSINIPFILTWDKNNQELDLNAKTVMRKKNFQTPDRILPVGSKNKPQEPIEKEKVPTININGVKWGINIEDETIFKKNKPQVIHKVEDVLDSLDEPTQEKILSFF